MRRWVRVCRAGEIQDVRAVLSSQSVSRVEPYSELQTAYAVDEMHNNKEDVGTKKEMIEQRGEVKSLAFTLNHLQKKPLTADIGVQHPSTRKSHMIEHHLTNHYQRKNIRRGHAHQDWPKPYRLNIEFLIWTVEYLESQPNEAPAASWTLSWTLIADSHYTYRGRLGAMLCTLTRAVSHTAWRSSLSNNDGRSCPINPNAEYEDPPSQSPFHTSTNSHPRPSLQGRLSSADRLWRPHCPPFHSPTVLQVCSWRDLLSSPQ